MKIVKASYQCSCVEGTFAVGDKVRMAPLKTRERMELYLGVWVGW
jgi:hypothetical protein